MRHRPLPPIAAIAVALTVTAVAAPLRAEVTDAFGVTPVHGDHGSWHGNSPGSSDVLPAVGVDSVNSLSASTAVTGEGAGKPVVEAIPTPTAFLGGVVVLGLLACFRLIRKLKRA